MVRQRVRIRFRKVGDLRLVGHRDLLRFMERLFRRAGLKLGMSEGFHPKPRMSFPSALAVGIEGLDEVMELELAEPANAEQLHARLQAQAALGLEFASIEVLPPGARKAQLRSTRYEVPIPAELAAGTAHRIDEILAGPSCIFQRPRTQQPLDLRESLEELAFHDGTLFMRLGARRQASAQVRDVLAALGLSETQQAGLRIRRTQVELES